MVLREARRVDFSGVDGEDFAAQSMDLRLWGVKRGIKQKKLELWK